MRKLLLWYYRRKLKREYAKLTEMTDHFDCGYALAEYMSVSISRQSEKVDRLYIKCKALDTEWQEILRNNDNITL